MPVPPDKVVMSSAMVTLVSTTSASVLPKEYGGMGELPSIKLLVGTSLTFMGLGIMADFAPGFAGPLSAAIAVTALTFYGFPIMDNWFNHKTNAAANAVGPDVYPSATGDSDNPRSRPRGPQGLPGRAN